MNDPLDPAVAWYNLRNRIELSFYMKPEEEVVIEGSFLSTVNAGTPAIWNVNTGGDPSNPANDPPLSSVCIFQVVGDWSIPVEISCAMLMEGVDAKGAVGTPTATDPVGVATQLAEFINGNIELIAKSNGSVVEVRAITPYLWMTAECTPEYIPAQI
jgi:hypothetical protein